MKFLAELLVKNNLTLASCESLTCGLFASTITEIFRASKIFKGGFITYNDDIKNKLVIVSLPTLEKYGAISKERAEEMATNTQ